MFKGNKAMLVAISLLISIAAFILVFFITYNLACIVSPPYFVEENGERHGLMPIGQVFLGIILGTITSIISLIICYKKFKKKSN